MNLKNILFSLKQILAGICFSFVFWGCSSSSMIKVSGKQIEISYPSLAEFRNNDFFLADSVVVFHLEEMYKGKPGTDTFFVPATQYVMEKIGTREMRNRATPFSIIYSLQYAFSPQSTYSLKVNDSLSNITLGKIVLERKDHKAFTIQHPEDYPIIVKAIED